MNRITMNNKMKLRKSRLKCQNKNKILTMKKGKSQHLLKSLSLISLKISRIPLMLLRKLHPKT